MSNKNTNTEYISHTLRTNKKSGARERAYGTTDERGSMTSIKEEVLRAHILLFDERRRGG